MTRVAVVLFGAATLLSHPPRDAPPQRPATGTIRGRVVAEASGAPIRNARVSVTDDYERPPVLSDLHGRFAFPALPAGSFTVTAGKAGFAKTTFGARSPGAAEHPSASPPGRSLTKWSLRCRAGPPSRARSSTTR
jgi:hypothetical protein